MSPLDAAILGLVEGVTEYLPVSSTGHLIITADLLGLTRDERVESAVDTFNIVVQGGAILAVLGLYFPRVLWMLKSLLRFRDPILAVVLGLEALLDTPLFPPLPVLAALFLGGIWMIWLDHHRRKKAQRRTAQTIDESDPEAVGAGAGEKTIDQMTPMMALGIGLMQSVAMWPGTSRSMMTIAGGTLLGLRPRDAAEFSFLLGLPTLGGACVYSLWKDLSEAHETGRETFIDVLGWPAVLTAIVVATVSAALAVKWLVSFLNRHGLAPFGWYRIVLCAVMGVLIWTNVVSV